MWRAPHLLRRRHLELCAVGRLHRQQSVALEAPAQVLVPRVRAAVVARVLRDVLNAHLHKLAVGVGGR